MFGRSEKIYNVYEKPEAHEPTERVVMLCEGFSFWAFLFSGLWLLMKREWRLLAMYVAAAVAMGVLCEALNLSEASAMCVQLWLQFMLGFHAYDAQGWACKRRGYRFTGVLVAPNEMAAEQRYYAVAS